MLTIIEEASGYCGKCLKQVAVRRIKVRHLLHLIITLLTAGLWLIIWLREINKNHQWHCMRCGTIVYKIMQPI